MRSGQLVVLFGLLLIGVILITETNVPRILSTVGGIIALVAGLVFAFTIFRLVRG